MIKKNIIFIAMALSGALNVYASCSNLSSEVGVRHTINGKRASDRLDGTTHMRDQNLSLRIYKMNEPNKYDLVFAGTCKNDFISLRTFGPQIPDITLELTGKIVGNNAILTGKVGNDTYEYYISSAGK